MSRDSYQQAAGNEITGSRLKFAFINTAHMKEVIRMINEPMNFAKASSITARQGWLGD